MLMDTLRQDLVSAMKAGEKLRVSVLRMVLSDINYRQIEVQRDMADTDVVEVLRKAAKKRQEAIESYTAGGRTEQAESERQELEIISGYLPQLMSMEQLKQEIAQIELPPDFGTAMRLVAGRFKGRAEGARIAQAVKEVLGANH